MDIEKFKIQIGQLRAQIPLGNNPVEDIRTKTGELRGLRSEALELIKAELGTRNAFYEELKVLKGTSGEFSYGMSSILYHLERYLGSGIHEGIGLERQIQIDTVSDYLDQARLLLDDKRVHPAAPAVLIGASLEEFLRSWIEAEGLGLGKRKPSIDGYTQVLRDAGLITKQDQKDINSWAGIRNDAAHGKWEQVSETKRIKLMLESVNFFMQKYGVKR